jgi:hypothetical protein
LADATPRLPPAIRESSSMAVTELAVRVRGNPESCECLEASLLDGGQHGGLRAERAA